jgi:hypothetical protein
MVFVSSLTENSFRFFYISTTISTRATVKSSKTYFTGSTLLRHFKSFPSIEVRQSNNAAINLYKSFGFKEIGTRKKYYKNEDALVLNLINHKESVL